MYRSAVLNRSKITQSNPRNDPCNSNIYSDGWSKIISLWRLILDEYHAKFKETKIFPKNRLET